MAFCNQCGAQLQDGAQFCPSCGAQQTPAAQQAPNGNGANGVNEFVDKTKNMIANTADFTAQMDPADIEQNKGMAVLSYIWILFLVPIFAAPQSKFARFHANQGLVLCICFVISSIFWAIPFIKYILGTILYLAWIGFVVIGIMNCVNGKAKELPFIGRIRILKN